MHGKENFGQKSAASQNNYFPVLLWNLETKETFFLFPSTALGNYHVNNQVLSVSLPLLDYYQMFFLKRLIYMDNLSVTSCVLFLLVSDCLVLWTRYLISLLAISAEKKIVCIDISYIYF